MNLLELVKAAREIGTIQKDAEINAFAGFLLSLSPKNVMEIGSWKGGLFYLISQINPHEGLKITVDLDGYNNFDMNKRNETILSWGSNIRLANGDSHSQEMLRWVEDQLKGEKLDFLMIDGDHSYEGSKMDYQMYKHLVRPGGWVGFHDILETPFHRKMGCNVSQTWQEIVGEKHEIVVSGQWGGIGLVKV